MTKLRVRFAPSPTGYLHVGGLRTALYNFLFLKNYKKVKKGKGEFILRIEDTDQERKVKNGITALLISLGDFFTWDEGPFWKGTSQEDGEIDLIKDLEQKGEHGPYIQSQRLEIYKKYADQLVKDGHAYYCFCEPERLEEMRKDQQAMKKPPIYDRYCLQNVSEEEINKNLKNNCSYTIRLKIPENETVEFEDIVRGKVKFNTDLIDDQVLLKSDGFPTYHLAVVVDDHEMNITHVIRGEEWLPSTPKHILLYRYFGWEIPKYAHLPLLLNADKSKLSKRQGDVAVEDYIKKGYLREAIINFVALLGWNPGKGETQEIFTVEELIEKFDLANVHKGGAVFDIKKLDWMNAEWIKKISIDELYERSLPFFRDFYKKIPSPLIPLPEGEEGNVKKSEEYLKKVLTVERGRLSKLSEVGESNKFFFSEINYGKELLRWKDMDDKEIKKFLEITMGCIEKNTADIDYRLVGDDKRIETIQGLKVISSALFQVIEDNDCESDKGKILWPLRAALTGEQKSPSPFEVAWVLGKKETIKRIRDAINLI